LGETVNNRTLGKASGEVERGFRPHNFEEELREEKGTSYKNPAKNILGENSEGINFFLMLNFEGGSWWTEERFHRDQGET